MWASWHGQDNDKIVTTFLVIFLLMQAGMDEAQGSPVGLVPLNVVD